MSKTLLKQREFFFSAEMSAGLKYKNSRIEVEVRMDRDNDVGTSFVRNYSASRNLKSTVRIL